MAEPSRPAVTTPQIAGILLAGIPIVAQLLHVFGVIDLTFAQQAALGNIIQWATVSAGTLFVADAGLRAARNHAHAKVAQSRVFREPVTPSPITVAPGEPVYVTDPKAPPVVKPKPKPRTRKPTVKP